MSFAKEAKSNLCTVTVHSNCCKLALLYGILLCSTLFDRQKIKFITENDDLIKLTLDLLKECADIEGNLYGTEKKRVEEIDGQLTSTFYYSYKITVSIKKELEKLFSLFHYTEEETVLSFQSEVIQCPKCQAAFLRGVFLSCGVISNPESGYHLEFPIASLSLSQQLNDFLSEIPLPPKMTIRKSMHILYYKESERIEDFLTYIGAQQAAFDIMNKKIFKDIRNNANRIANCETANIDKMVVAAQLHIEAIRGLIETKRIALLSPELQKTAYLRLENEELSLTELGELFEPPITKSGVNHRLKKILNFAQGKD